MSKLTNLHIGLKHRLATLDDVPILAKMNKKLTEDEKHRNQTKSYSWFKQRMKTFIKCEYQAVLFELDEVVVAYALYRPHNEHSDTIYLRQLYVDRSVRKQGIGRFVINTLKEQYWTLDKRLFVEVLADNQTAIRFYTALGFQINSLEFELQLRD